MVKEKQGKKVEGRGTGAGMTKKKVKQALGERRAELNHLVCLTVFNFSLLRLLFKKLGKLA